VAQILIICLLRVGLFLGGGLRNLVQMGTRTWIAYCSYFAGFVRCIEIV
jgi:hypothetical protein